MPVFFSRLLPVILITLSLGQPALAAGAPGCQDENSNERSLPCHVLLDQKWFWTRPGHIKPKDLAWVLPFTGITAGLIAADGNIERNLPDSPGVINRTREFSTGGVAALAGAAGGLYLWGRMRDDDRAHEAGLLSAEALAGSFLDAEVVKLITRRERPLERDLDGSFGDGGGSFPSQHATAAWSVAEVIAEEYPRPLTRVLVYGLATAVSATRVTGRRHFSSDVFVGSALGWYMGWHVFHAHHAAAPDSKFGSFVRKDPRR